MTGLAIDTVGDARGANMTIATRRDPIKAR
jgi:hypothetical protein